MELRNLKNGMLVTNFNLRKIKIENKKYTNNKTSICIR